MNPSLDERIARFDSPLRRLDALAGIATNPHLAPIVVSVGEPRDSPSGGKVGAGGDCPCAVPHAEDHGVRRAELRARPRNDQGNARRDDRAREPGIIRLRIRHEMGFAPSLADRVICMDRGQIVEQNIPVELFSNPESDRPKELLSKVLAH